MSGSRQGEPRPLESSLRELGAELGLPDPRALTGLLRAWPEVVGPCLATHASVRSARDGVVTVVVDDAPWATELRYREAQVVARLAQACGEGVVRSLRVVVAEPGRTVP